MQGLGARITQGAGETPAVLRARGFAAGEAPNAVRTPKGGCLFIRFVARD